MLYIALFSATLWVGTMLLARYELSHGVRIGGTVRRRIDRRLVRVGHGTQSIALHVVEFVKRDLVAQGLHIVSYTALLLVRWVERKLVRVNELLRSFRKKHTGPHAPRLRSLTDKSHEDVGSVR